MALLDLSREQPLLSTFRSNQQGRAACFQTDINKEVSPSLFPCVPKQY